MPVHGFILYSTLFYSIQFYVFFYDVLITPFKFYSVVYSDYTPFSILSSYTLLSILFYSLRVKVFLLYSVYAVVAH